MVNAWLLVVIAGLVVACFSLYVYAQRMESDSLMQRSLAEEELRTVEYALASAREQVHSQPIYPTLPSPTPTSFSHGSEDERLQAILNLRRSGKSTKQIARALDLPIGAIELLLSLENP